MSGPDRVLVAGARRGDGVRDALAGWSLYPVGDRYAALGALRAEDIDVVVVADPALTDELLGVVRDTAPAARIVIVGTAPAGPLPPLVTEYVLPEHVATVLRPAVHRAARDRGLTLAAGLHERTVGLAELTDPVALGQALAAAARDASAADHAAWIARGPDGAFHVAATVGPAGAAPPLPVLVRWTERLERERPAAPVAETRGERHLAGVIVANANHFHGAVWVSRALSRRTFARRELDAVSTVGSRALLAAEHHRLIQDLQHRLLSMEATRSRLEEDARAASVGRLAVDALIAIRDPLAYTRTNLRAAVDANEIPPGSQAARHVEYALQGLARADRAVEDLSRVSQGRDRVPVEVRQLVESALSLVRPLAHPETIEIGENAVILGNPGRLAQALAELLRNADQATGATRVDLSATRLKEVVAIEIADDGEGIAADLLPRVTEPFFSTRGRAGLGLTTAKDIVERAGGTIEIRSRRGVGTVVRVLLPGERVDDELEFGGEPDDDEPVSDLGSVLD
jgi:signal transduction histidine kinase